MLVQETDSRTLKPHLNCDDGYYWLLLIANRIPGLYGRVVNSREERRTVCEAALDDELVKSML
jgi:hypothetical protein